MSHDDWKTTEPVDECHDLCPHGMEIYEECDICDAGDDEHSCSECGQQVHVDAGLEFSRREGDRCYSCLTLPPL